MSEYLNKQAVLESISEAYQTSLEDSDQADWEEGYRSALRFVKRTIQSGAFDADKKSLSDGYHTFEELYYHRMMLFAVICKAFKDCAWKSWKHHDGTMYDDMFIVGIETPQGHYTYHYNSLYWNVFDVKELERAPEWDGHQPKDVTRLISLPFDAQDNLSTNGGGHIGKSKPHRGPCQTTRARQGATQGDRGPVNYA